ncbi:cell division protein FtsL [Sediminibacillus dalangtanensis]|uniref:Cell division protein FtsL n=1 Tax=Sediminibacillus dalangtanensis TaxID=2729421 RepID=A0ABX7VUP7_9BACI|nr:cell division protein FtsL [Sediminibacillus dalangtanensis]QTM99330.1 cell division protein FtsL [Sediminibacillus dalangtanensis]
MSTSPLKNWQDSWQETGRQTVPDTKKQVKVKVQKKKWITTGEKFIYTIFSALLVGALYFSVSLSSSTDALNREVQQLEQQVERQQEINQNLEYKAKDLSNPDRILRIAKENGLKIQNTEVKQATQISE